MNNKLLRRLFTICTVLISIIAFNCFAYASSGKETVYLHIYPNGEKDDMKTSYTQGIYNDIKCEVISNSNPSVVKVKAIKETENEQNIHFIARKTGTATVKYKYVLDNSPVKWIAKVKVHKYKCPFKQLKIGKTDLTKYFKKYTFGRSKKTALSGKLNLKLNPGWKLYKGWAWKTGQSTNAKKMKNGSNVVLKSSGMLWLKFVNKKLDDEVAIHLYLS